MIRDVERLLPPRLRGAIEAHYWKEMSVHDAATLSGITVAAAKSRQMRERKTLRVMLDSASGYNRKSALS